MKKVTVLFTRKIGLAPIIGIGYWKDVYDEEKLGIGGWTHNVILPFVRVQWGALMGEKKEERVCSICNGKGYYTETHPGSYEVFKCRYCEKK